MRSPPPSKSATRRRDSIVHYGYDEETPGYQAEREGTLAARLGAMVKDRLKSAGVKATAGSDPFVEVNRRKQGVHIRSLTHIPEDVRDAIVADADRIFNDVMGLCYECGAGVVTGLDACPGCKTKYGTQEGVTKNGAHRRTGLVPE